MLKSLELFGFKSFADRTLFEFSPGITCVVGPNGSGKSNVVDAIKWILGDQSAKSLRGKEMSDVIFNGSSGRRANGFAEATLTFDNSAGVLPIDMREVSVGRRLYQSGDSEYLLNGAGVRLKDIRDLFMGTGAGTAAYSIIEQGRVDQILQANPATRRLVFEEAAGISKFKSRRADAERRLERVAQNLLRLTDIVDEVESQLNSTRTQASKAARYHELSTELKSLWTGLAADDFRHISYNLEQQHAQLTELNQQQERIQQQVAELESQRISTDQQIADFDDKLIDHERTIAGNRQSIATSESTIHHQSTRLQEVEQELTRLRKQRARLLSEVQELEVEFQAAQQALHDFAQQCEAARKAVAEQESSAEFLEQQIRNWRNEIEARGHARADVQKQRAAVIERLAILESQLQANQEQLRSAQDEWQNREQRVHAATLEKEQLQQRVHEVQSRYQQAQAAVQSLQDQRNAISDQKSQAQQQLLELRERRSADAARLAVLEELERRHEGIAIGVQEILKRAATSHYPPWNKMLGLVRDLIDAPLELAPIIDAALGERAQYVATTDLNALFNYLDRGAAPIDGRVGFVAIGNAQSQSQQKSHSPSLPSSIVPDLTGQPGVFGRADRLVTESGRAIGVATAVLGDTWIVESLRDAQRLLADHPLSELRFVTLQGEVLTPDGELFVGTIPHEASIVSRRSELRQLRNGILQCDKHIEALMQRQSILSESIQARHDELSAKRTAVEEHASRLSECRTMLVTHENELARLIEEQAQQSERVDSLQSREQEMTVETQQLNQQLGELATQVETMQTDIEQRQLQIRQAEQRLDELARTTKSRQLEVAKQEERLTGLQQARARIEKEHRHAKAQSEDLNQRFHDAQRALSSGRFAVLAAQQKIAKQTLAMEQTLRETRQFFVQRESLRQLRKQLAGQEDELHKQRRRIRESMHEHEISIQKLQHHLTATADRIFDEFQIPLDQLVSSGASAYHIYLTERYGDDYAEIEQLDDATTADDDDSTDVPATPRPATPLPSFSEVREEIETRVDRLRRKVKGMGHVNTEALENLEELESRYHSMNSQLQDLQQAKSSLEDIIRKINNESERIFLETFETIRSHFQELFRKLFGGGDADIILEDPDDVLECGIDIVARPPGKELRSISLLSGGEKTMTAVGLLFAMFKSKPSPYCILDEVDAALDDANVDRYVAVVQEFVEMTQFVIITHRKRTMTAAHVLYGVTMEQAGVSKRISVKFEDVSDNGEIKAA